MPIKRILRISWDQKATFIRRCNRFVVECLLQDGKERVLAHLKDPGRLKELLYPGNQIFLKQAQNVNRKTKWDVISVRGSLGEDVLVNSGYHSRIARQILTDPQISPFGELSGLRAEVKTGASRLDFWLETKTNRQYYLEVKGCTLVKDGRALFPDAPTSRGRRHLEELITLSRSGLGAAVIFLIFCRGVNCFQANVETDPDFSATLQTALDSGVEVWPILLEYRDQHITYKGVAGLCTSLNSG